MKMFSQLFLAILMLITAYVAWIGDTEAIDQWGESHYTKFGKAEHRILPANGNYGDYVRSYSDLLDAYGLTVRNANNDQSFHSCSYVKPTLSCSGIQGAILKCGLVGRGIVTCSIEGTYGESFNTCSLIGKGFACIGTQGGMLNCKLIGRTVLCDYKSRR